ncbi:hypothetical protein D6C97_05682 [Aureobasidium pullulans]|nr:hypothetical protein D6C97_05682 [Aureobasidium pullulans]
MSSKDDEVLDLGSSAQQPQLAIQFQQRTIQLMAVSFDNYYWEDDNITDVCDGNCTLQARDWDLGVSLACGDGEQDCSLYSLIPQRHENATDMLAEWISAYGKLVPADSISGRFVDGLNTVCLGSTTDDRWCLGASQNWTGVDVITPDCDVNPADPSCTSDVTLPENMRLANLYTDDVLCDNCFVQMLYARVTSPYLDDSDQSDFLVSQLQDIGDVCNITIPEITIRALPSYADAPMPTSIDFESTATSTISSAAATTTCDGQIIASGSGCAALSTKYGLTTGDLQKLTGSDTCVISASTCFPAACTLGAVPTGATCESFATSISVNTTTVQLLLWNPNIQGLCDSLTAGQSVCVAAPGVKGTYTLAAPPLGTGADAANQQRGGPGGRVTPCPTYTNLPDATSAAGPVQTGIVANCNAWAMADLGIGCFDFATQNCINTTQLWAWNGVLGKDGTGCQNSFWAKEYYCVNTYAASSATHTSTTSKTGIPQYCSKFAQPASGTGCYDFATAQGITPAQLYAWNPALGSNGANCGTAFYAEDYYCVAVPVQTGIAANCNKYATPVGVGCYDFATQQGITQAQLYTWNPALGTNGANCGTAFWAQEYYCVGVSS